mmetsp:Transcript_5479/g.8514  ORF Transcript_5479/g.8514 Transcript_5479/m.8514 type:complete len:292 (+) Transcript_5479:130-1005(+)
MGCTPEEFQELLSAEMYVEMDKLRQASRHGVPDSIRGEVWKYLLDVSKPDKSEEISQRKRMAQDYGEFLKGPSDSLKHIKGELRRFQSKLEMNKSDKKVAEFFKSPAVMSKFENVMLAYTNNNSEVPYNQGMVYLMAPFVFTLTKEPEIYFCFQGLMSRLEDNFTPQGINHAVANFMILFRSVNSELYNSFEEEELEPNEWVLSWLQFLLCRELPTECVLRLWDTYFSTSEGIDLHVYSCLAILEHCQEELLELDHAELHAFLQHLPIMDMDQIINKAYRIKDDVIAQKII